MHIELTHESNRIFANDTNGQLIADITFPAVSEGRVDINHTFVHESLRGQGIADMLMQAAIETINAKGLKTDTNCPYAKKWFLSHPEFNHLL